MRYAVRIAEFSESSEL